MAPGQHNGTTPGSSWARETLLTLAPAGLVIQFSALLLLWDRGFFWIDDSQSGALPVYCDMARAWRSGEVPLLNSTSWRAGALGAELLAAVLSAKSRFFVA